jgi:hypothetical protein
VDRCEAGVLPDRVQRADPDEKWDQAVQIVKGGTSWFSATNLVVAKNNSGDHDVSISGSDGVDFKLSSQKAAAFTGRSDCRM